MQTNLTGLAVLLAILAVGIAGYTLMQEPAAQDSAAVDRLDRLEERLAGLEQALVARDLRVSLLDGPSLATTEPRVVESAPAGFEMPVGSGASGVSEGAPTGSAPVGLAQPVEEIQALIDKAVEKKAAQIQRMRDKKPTIDVFAKALELTELQREAVEQDVVQSQREIKAMLEIPAEDGTNFLDELVEIMAHGIAEPGQNPGRGIKLFGRLMSENIPGTDETYAARAEAIKSTLRASFKRNWTEKQYAAFEAWQMDPTEVKDIEGSPWKAVEGRVIERARALGAEIPGDDQGPR